MKYTSQDTLNHPWMSAERFLALSQVGTTLMSELDEQRLLQLIARTACDLTGATFAAFSLRPMDEAGQPQSPAEGPLFHLAAVIGVTPEQEALFRRMPLGGEELLAPIFRHELPVLVADALAPLPVASHAAASHPSDAKAAAQKAAFAFAQGQLPLNELLSLGMPEGHPLLCSFLGVPLLDRVGEVRGRLLLGHADPDQFTAEDQAILLSLAGQAAFALENFRLRAVARQAQERTSYLEATFEAMVDGVFVYDQKGGIAQMNSAAHTLVASTLPPGAAARPLDERLGEAIGINAEGQQLTPDQWPSIRMLQGEQFTPEHAMELQMPTHDGGVLYASVTGGPIRDAGGQIIGAVAITRDVTEPVQLEQHLRASEREARERTAQLGTIFEAIPDGLIISDASGNQLRVNSATRALFGLQDRPEALAGSIQTLAQSLQLCDEDGQLRPGEQVAITRILSGETLLPSNPSIAFIRALDGQLHYLSTTGAPLYDEDGHIIGAVSVSRDITEQKQAERLLQEQSRLLQEAERRALERTAQLETIFEAIPDALFITDARGELVQINSATRALFGLQDRPEAFTLPMKMLGQELRHHNEDGQPLAGEQLALTHILRGETVSTSNPTIAFIRMQDGQMCAISTTGAPLYGEDGQIIGAITVTRDITEQNRAERQREQQAQQLRLQAGLIEMAHDAIIVRDLNSVILSWNQGAEALYGWSAQEAIGQVIQDLLQTRFPISKQVVDHMLQREGRWEGELVHTSRDGSTVYVESRQVLLRDASGQPNAFLGINRDMTAQRHLEQLERSVRTEARSRLALMQLILDELPSCIYVVRGPDARLVLANRAAAAVFGAKWAPGQPMREFLTRHHIRILRPDGHPLEQAQLPSLQAVQQGETVRQFQQVIQHTDGTTLSVLVNAVPLDAASLPEGTERVTSDTVEPERVALVVCQDVTAIKDAEALKYEFLNVVSHELRTPLSILKGYADLLLLQASRGSDVPFSKLQLEGLQGISRAASRLTNLTEDLLDVTRLQVEQLDLPGDPADLGVQFFTWAAQMVK